jgi:hypothetical protein
MIGSKDSIAIVNSHAAGAVVNVRPLSSLLLLSLTRGCRVH